MLLEITPSVTPPAPRADRRALEDPSEKRKAGPDGRPHLRVSYGAHPAPFAACKRHVLQRARSTSCGVQAARLPAYNRRVLRRAAGTSCGVQAIRLPAFKRHVFQRTTGASCGAVQARIVARNRRVSRRANGASRDTHLARCATCNQHVSAACILRCPAHPEGRKSERYKASNLHPSPLGSAAGKV